MSVERIHKRIVKTRYFFQACLLAASLYGCVTRAYASFVSPKPVNAGQENFSAVQLRTTVVSGDQKALEAQFVGKKAEALKAFGISGVPDQSGKLRYTTGFSYEYFNPGDGPWPRQSVKSVEFTVDQGVISGINLYGFQ